MDTNCRVRTLRYSKGEPGWAEFRDEIAVEEPVELWINGQNVAVFMRTPGNDEELAAGFLLSEGIIQCTEDIQHIAATKFCVHDKEENLIAVELGSAIKVDPGCFSRNLVISSSCGVCSQSSIDAIHRKFPPVSSDLQLEPHLLYSMPKRLLQAQDAFNSTGGIHACALFSADGKLLVLREDVGRHNALDKVLGYALFQKWLPLKDNILLLSGRSSFELVQKAVSGGVPIIAALGAPSSLAIGLAQEYGQTLIGFLGEKRMNLYTHPQRVCFFAC